MGREAGGEPNRAARVVDVELERAALYALLSEPTTTWPIAREHWSPDLFAVPTHRLVAEAAARRIEAGSPGDAILVGSDLIAVGQPAAAQCIRGVVHQFGTVGNAAHYFERLAANRDAKVAAAADRDAEVLGPLSVGQALASEASRLEEGVERVSSGWERLDAALGGGFAVPSLNILGAAPKSGKSTWAQIVATRHVEAGGVVYYLDLENGRRRFLRQLLCRRAELGGKDVANALRNRGDGIFASREAVERWQEAKRWVAETLVRGLFCEFTPPDDFAARLRAIRRVAGTRRLVVVVDSLQKLPGQLDDRRAVVDAWVRLFERLRHELDAVFVVISEIKRNGKGEYQASESAFKESGGIEYAADLAMTLTRPRADENEEAVSTLRVELARDADEDPRGDVASYAPVFPHYGLDERAPAARSAARRRGPRAEKGEAACAFLKRRLAAGPANAGEVVREGEAEGLSRTALYKARDEIGVVSCTLNLKAAWRLP
jgi:replicative DNA helicase